MRQRGFTLMEMLIALAIFALIGVASYRLLQATAQASEEGMARSDALHDQMLALQLIDSDLTQILPASIRLDEAGLQFLRAGASFGLPGRSDLRQLRYSVDGEVLQREVLPVADNTENSRPLQQALRLEGSQFVIQDTGGRTHTIWPVEDEGTAQVRAILLSWGQGGRRVFSLQ